MIEFDFEKLENIRIYAKKSFEFYFAGLQIVNVHNSAKNYKLNFVGFVISFQLTPGWQGPAAIKTCPQRA